MIADMSDDQFRPTAIMLRALVPLQRDLDVSGLERYQMSYAAMPGWPENRIVNIQYRGTWTSDSIDFECDDDAAMLDDIARATVQLFMDHEDVYWPMCSLHDRRTRSTVVNGEVLWVCSPMRDESHVLAAIGHLGDALSKNPKPIWKRLDRR
jgi:hypothetical protein